LKEDNMAGILAIDAGGTKTSCAVIDKSGRLLTEVKTFKTPKTKAEIEQLFRRIIKEYENDTDACAFATAGSVNYDNTKVEGSTPNMPEGYCSIDFSSLSSKKVFVENDANAAAWAEYKTGAAKGDKNTVTITLGTGVGGGFIADGKLIRGKSGRAGEIGSIKINGRGRICTCGRKDCFEAYASGTGLKITAQETAENDSIFKSGIYKDKNPCDITTYDIIDGIKKHDAYSIRVFKIWKQDIITGLINITDIFDPESIIISGGLGKFIDTEEIETAVNSEIVTSPVKIRLAKAGNYSGMIGAALLAYEKFAQ